MEYVQLLQCPTRQREALLEADQFLACEARVRERRHPPPQGMLPEIDPDRQGLTENNPRRSGLQTTSTLKRMNSTPSPGIAQTSLNSTMEEAPQHGSSIIRMFPPGTLSFRSSGTGLVMRAN